MKFKFINFSYPYELLMIEDDGWPEVPCPLPYSNLPDGEYMIRGNQKEHRKNYWKVEGVWFLTSESTKDNGHYLCDAERYALYPQKPESFWKKLDEVPWKCLTKYWQRALYGYQFNMDLRKSSRRNRKDWMHLFDDLDLEEEEEE